MKRLLRWLTDKFSPKKDSPRPDLSQSGAHITPAKTAFKAAVPRRQPEYIDFDPDQEDGMVPGLDPRNRTIFIREETGTHETLTIVGDSPEKPTEESGIDPYNTGQFDRSKHWDQRFRKN
jgi:hypothetical protein